MACRLHAAAGMAPTCLAADHGWAVSIWCGVQAMKNNPTCTPLQMKVNDNRITREGQTALKEGVDTVYDIGGGRVVNVLLSLS